MLKSNKNSTKEYKYEYKKANDTEICFRNNIDYYVIVHVLPK